MNKISISAIHTLFEKIAETLPDIGHKPGNDNRFFSIDYEDFLSGTRSDISFPCMGLSFRQESRLPGTIKSTGTASQLRMTVAISFLAESNEDKAIERSNLDDMLACLKYVYDFMEKKASSPDACNFPILNMWDIEQGMRFFSVSDAGFDDAVGWILFIPLRESLSFDLIANPLNTLSL